MLETKSDDTLGDDKSILSWSSSTRRQRRWVDVRGGRLEEHQEGGEGVLTGAGGAGGAGGHLLEQEEEGAASKGTAQRIESPRRFAGALCCSSLLLLLLHVGLMLAPTRATRRRRWNFVGRWNQCVLLYLRHPPLLPRCPTPYSPPKTSQDEGTPCVLDLLDFFSN